MKIKRIIPLLLTLVFVLGVFAGCKEKEENKPLMSLATVLDFADSARQLELPQFSPFEYVVLGSSEMPLYYFPMRESDFSFTIGIDENGAIESMMLSHISGEETYLFHKNPAKLDPNATQYTEDAKSYDLQKFIDKVTEK